MHEGQAGFRMNRSCIYEIVQGRLKEGKQTYILFRCTESL